MKTLFMMLALVSSVAAGAQQATEHDRSPREVSDVEMVDLYYPLSDLALADQRDEMWGLHSDTKAALWRYNIERYLRTHPELGAEAQEVLRDGIRLVSTPRWFDIVKGSAGYEIKALAREELESRAKSVLSPEAIHEIFIRLGPEPFTPESEGKNRVETNGPFGGMCSCADDFDCGSTSSYHCYTAWCIDTTHCGFYGDEICTGKCKYTGD